MELLWPSLALIALVVILFAAERRFPAANVWTGPDGLVVSFELPGLDPAQIELTIEAESLTVKGRREPDPLPPGAAPLRADRWHGEFARTLRLPARVDPDQSSARYQRGVLEVLMPRSLPERPRKVAVEAV